jgi:hypothetical protein
MAGCAARVCGRAQRELPRYNRPDNVFGPNARGCFETGAQSCAATRHQRSRVYAAAKKRVKIKLALILPASVRYTLFAKLFVIDAAILFQHVSLQGPHQIVSGVVEQFSLRFRLSLRSGFHARNLPQFGSPFNSN